MCKSFSFHKKGCVPLEEDTQPFFLLRDRNSKFRLAAAALHADLAAVQTHDPFDNGKSDAGALAGMGFVRLIEFIEDIRQTLRGNIWPGVRNMDLNLVILFFD